jgi:hypothetical protein
MKYVASLLTLSAMVSLGSVAQADTATPLTPFGVQYRQKIPSKCPDARTAAYNIGRDGNGVSAEQAHRATRAFIDCTNIVREYDGVDPYLVLISASSELLAAQRETGSAAVASTQNALAFLKPIGARGRVLFYVGYRNAPPALGPAAIVPVVKFEDLPYPTDPSGISGIANILIGQVQGTVPRGSQ